MIAASEMPDPNFCATCDNETNKTIAGGGEVEDSNSNNSNDNDSGDTQGSSIQLPDNYPEEDNTKRCESRNIAYFGACTRYSVNNFEEGITCSPYCVQRNIKGICLQYGKDHCAEGSVCTPTCFGGNPADKTCKIWDSDRCEPDDI